jgi:thiol-disulfide isomerase/thioredoxin
MKPLSRRRGLSLLAGSVMAPLAWSPVRAAPAAAGEAVVWPRVSLLDGSAWGPARTEGKAVVAVFWSLTCPYCQRHNDHIEALRRAAQGQALELITVVRENDTSAVQRHVQRRGWQFAVTLDNPPMAAALSMRRITPLTVTVDRQGRVLQVIPGEMSEDDVLGLRKLAT